MHMCPAAAVRFLGLAGSRTGRTEELDALELLVADVGAEKGALLVHLAQETQAGVSEPLVGQAQKPLGLFVGHRVSFRVEILWGGGVLVAGVISDHRIERVRRHDRCQVSAGHLTCERAGIVVRDKVVLGAERTFVPVSTGECGRLACIVCRGWAYRERRRDLLIRWRCGGPYALGGVR